MNSPSASENMITLDLEQSLWERFLAVAPLVVIGSKELSGQYDLAPKHMAMPLGWNNYFGFVCTPTHRTYQNIVREGVFTVSFPQPSQIVLTSLAAAPRCEDSTKSSLTVLPTAPATVIEGFFLQNAYLWLECALVQTIDEFEVNSLIAGRILAAHLHVDALRTEDQDDQEILTRCPLLAFLPPNRYAIIDHSYSFPFHQGFQK